MMLHAMHGCGKGVTSSFASIPPRDIRAGYLHHWLPPRNLDLCAENLLYGLAGILSGLILPAYIKMA